MPRGVTKTMWPKERELISEQDDGVCVCVCLCVKESEKPHPLLLKMAKYRIHTVVSWNQLVISKKKH